MKVWEVWEEELIIYDGLVASTRTCRGTFVTETEADELIKNLSETQERYANPKQHSVFTKKQVSGGR